jgi:hypothetical protein
MIRASQLLTVSRAAAEFPADSLTRITSACGTNFHGVK